MTPRPTGGQAPDSRNRLPGSVSRGRGESYPRRQLSHQPKGPDQAPLPPHLPVLTLKLPHDSGARHTEIRSLESGR